MSKAPEDKGGATQQQTQECSCGYAQWTTLERYPTASAGRRISAEARKGGGGVIAANPALAGSSSSRDPAPAAALPSLQDRGRSGDVKSPSAHEDHSLQRVRSFRESGRNGDLQQAQAASGTVSPTLTEERIRKDSRRCGDVQLPKSPSGSASSPCLGDCSIGDSRRSGALQQQQQQQAKSISGNGSQSIERGRSFRDGGRGGDLQQAESPSETASPSFKGERSLRDSNRSGDVQQPKFPLSSAAPSCQVERSFRDSRGSRDAQQAKSPSFFSSPHCEGEYSLRESRRSADVQQQQPKSVSDNASPSCQRERRIGDAQQEPKSPSINASPSCQRERRVGDAQQEPKSPSINASPAFERARSLRDSRRSGDFQQSKSPSAGSCSRATPVASSPPTSVKSGGFKANAASLTFPSRAARTDSSSSCTSLKSKLAAGQKLYGALLVSLSTVVAEILGWAGYDFVVVDLDQLFPGDTFAALPVLQALESTGTPAIFRLPGDDPVLVNKALDMGPAGLMFSMIENEEEARNAVASCRYPPRGMRRASRHMVSRASRYGLDVSYMDRCEEDLFVMCQVETMEALDQVMEIAGVEGVDCIHMGGLDFGASLGDPYLDFNTRLLLLHAEEKILSRQKKVLLAGFATPENSPEALFKRGYHLVSGSVDVILLRDAAVADLRRNKASLSA